MNPIGIVIPIYNVEKYLQDCLNSVLSQTYKNFQVLLINDGSTDSSRSIALEYVKKDPRFILVDKENGGLSDTRNTGINIFKFDIKILNSKSKLSNIFNLNKYNKKYREKITCFTLDDNLNNAKKIYFNSISSCKINVISHIIFLDSDDVWDKETLEVCNSIFSKINNIDFIMFNWYCTKDDFNINNIDYNTLTPRGHAIKITKENLLLTKLDFIKKAHENNIYNLYCSVTHMINFNFLIKSKLYFANIYHEDNLFSTLLCYFAENIYLYNTKPLYYHRIRTNSITQIDKTKNNFEDLAPYIKSDFYLFNNVLHTKNFYGSKCKAILWMLMNVFRNNLKDNEIDVEFSKMIRPCSNWMFNDIIEKYSMHDNNKAIFDNIFNHLEKIINEDSIFKNLHIDTKILKIQLYEKLNNDKKQQIIQLKNTITSLKAIQKNFFKNINEHATAKASSFSRWSYNKDLTTDANNVLKEHNLIYSFHTDLEEHPYLIIDLKQNYSISYLYIVNRIDGNQYRAKSLQVELSLDENNWQKIPQSMFIWQGNYDELIVNLTNSLETRFIKLSLTEKNYFHLKLVKIFTKQEIIFDKNKLIEFKNQLKHKINFSSTNDANIKILGYENTANQSIEFADKCDFKIQSDKDTQINFTLSPTTCSKLKNFKPISDFYSFTINNKEQLKKLTSSNLSNPLSISIVIKKDDIVDISLKARIHNYNINELEPLKSYLNINNEQLQILHLNITPKKRMAICLSGHMRTYEQTYQSFLKHIVKPNKIDGYIIDIFIHTWDTLNSDIKSWHEGRGYMKELNNIKLDEEILKKINMFYNPTSIIVEHLPDGMHGQTISRERLAKMVKEFADNNNYIYDCILFTRPDLMFKSDLNIDKYFKLYTNGLSNYSTIQLNDECFFTSSNIFKRMPVADPRYVNEGDLLFFHSAHTKPLLLPEPIYVGDEFCNIPIDYKLYHEFEIFRG